MSHSVRILALNPHHGGSHRAFLDGWVEHSRHEFDVLTLPPYKWKWRMRHAPVTFSQELRTRVADDPPAQSSPWDVLFCTDMLNLAEFLGLCPPTVRDLPCLVYFHENQLTYPNREDRERDLHFAFTNITTGLAADHAWFNSAFHRDEFLTAVDQWMRKMPDYQLVDSAETIRAKSAIHPPGLRLPLGESWGERPPRDNSPIRIAWVSRWEHDKDPDTFFAALRLFRARREPFRLSILGESFGNTPPIFAQAQTEFADHIDHWGFAASRDEYQRLLHKSDVVLSTAKHEFFGIGVLEAVAAGCFPLAPRALAYPEVLGEHDDFFHDGSTEGVADRLQELSRRVATGGACWLDRQLPREIVAEYRWSKRAAAMDREIETICAASSTSPL